MGAAGPQIQGEATSESRATSAPTQRRSVKLTLQELRGIVPAIPGRITTDFEDQIEDAMEEEAARIVDEMRER